MTRRGRRARVPRRALALALPLALGACHAPVERALELFAIEMSLESVDVPSGQRTPLPPPRVARSEAVSLALDDKLYLLGGYAPDGTPSPALEVYDPNANAWRRLADWPTPRLLPPLAAANGRLCAGQGYADLELLETVVAYDCYGVASGVWESLPALPDALENHSLVAVGDALYVLGGYDFGAKAHSSHSARYDFATAGWRVLTEAAFTFSAEHAVVLGADIYAATAAGSTVALVQYHTDSDKWSLPSQPPATLFGTAQFFLASGTQLVLGLADSYPDTGRPGRLDLVGHQWQLGKTLPSYGVPSSYTTTGDGGAIFLELEDSLIDKTHFVWDQLWQYVAPSDEWKLVSERLHPAGALNFFRPVVLDGGPYVVGNRLSVVPPPKAR